MCTNFIGDFLCVNDERSDDSEINRGQKSVHMMTDMRILKYIMDKKVCTNSIEDKKVCTNSIEDRKVCTKLMTDNKQMNRIWKLIFYI